MSYNFNWRRTVAIAATLLLATAGLAMAQQTSGNIFVSVVDDQGQALPGVTVTLTGQGAPQVNVTNAEGQTRFLGLAPGGGYQITAELEGFSTVEYPNIVVGVGRNTTVQITVTPAVEETITVTSESPLLDERKVSTGTTVTSVELEKIPTARDPWAVLQSVPGVLVDRVNVGGNESGQQSNFVGNGSGNNSGSWSVDGVVITDPAARGSSPTYYNFDAFEEMAISTGGSDINALTSGVQLNLVTKRGTNAWRISGRYLVTDNSWQSDPSVSSSALGQAGPWNNNNAQAPLTQTSSTESVDDYGIDFGGPLVKDRLWIWGTYGVQDVKAFQLGNGPPVPDDTKLESYAAKLNAQLTSNNSGILFYHYGDKVKNGRGAGPTRPQETTWNQTGPTDIYKLEDTHIFNSNLYLTGLVSHVGGGFALSPIGGIGDDPNLNLVWDQNGIWHNSFFFYSTDRPQDQAKVDGSYFFNTGNTNHELKFGVGYRHNEVTSLSVYPGQGLVGLSRFGAYYGASGTDFLGVAYHDIFVADEFDQWNVLLQDTITWGNVTVNAGIRYDLQSPTNLDAVQPAARLAPIPEFTRVGGDPGFEWESISPRIGITYALGEERDTLLRASYARFADQLGTGFFADLGVNVQQYQYFYWRDDNNDNIIDQSSIVFLPGLIGDRTVVANRVDPGLDPALTDELVLGVEHALLPEFVIGLQATYRQNSGAIVSQTLVQENGVVRPDQRNDYVQVGTVRGTLPNGSGFNEPVFALRDGVSLDPARGFLRRNSDLEDQYLGINFTFNKRLSNRWLLRGFVNYSDWTYENRSGNTRDITDPTPGIGTTTGDQVLVQSTGSGNKGEVWISSTWSANVSGLYQIAPDRPWGFNVSADINLREGFAIPYRTTVGGRSALTGDNIGRTVLVSGSTDSFRNDDVVLVNARIEKEFNFSDFGLTIGVDAFNLFNNNDALQTEGVVSSAYFNNSGTQVGVFNSNNADFIREVISPRIFRIGARFSWN
jgi:hypothetical protein